MAEDLTEQTYDAALEEYDASGDIEAAARAAGAVAAAGACAAVGAAPAAPVCGLVGDAVVGFVINEVVPFLGSVFGSDPPKPSKIESAPKLEVLRAFDDNSPDFWLNRSWTIAVNNLVWQKARLGLIRESGIDADEMRRVMFDLREAGIEHLRTFDGVVWFPAPHIAGAVAVADPLWPPNFWRMYAHGISPSSRNDGTAAAWLVGVVDRWVDDFVDRLALLSLAYSAEATVREARRVAARESGVSLMPTLRSGPSPARLARMTILAETERAERADRGTMAIGGAIATLGVASIAGAFVPKARRLRPYLLAGGAAGALGGVGLLVWSHHKQRGEPETMLTEQS